ncbi:MAG: hypothetical protein M5U26_13070 [Planctomycetota bacterium]|nr:hypothetical protein [Planctomycetota bacterium]
MRTQPASARVVVASGLALLALFYLLLRLSTRFIHGQDHEHRAILGFLGLWALASVVYFAAIRAVLRPAFSNPALENAHGWAWTRIWVLFVALGTRVLLISSNPIQEVDYARYLWDGGVLAHGENPYVYAPEEIEASYAADPGIGRLQELLDANSQARLAFSRIEHRGVRTIYPPLAQATFALSHWIAPWDLHGLRIVFLGFEIGSILLLFSLLRRLSLPPEWALIYAWSPLAIKELANSPHLDAIVVFCLALAAWAWVSEKIPLVAIALGLAVLAKTFPVVLVPAGAVAVARRKGKYKAFAFCVVVAAVIFAGYFPFLLTGGWRVFHGLGTFASEWRQNGSIYPLVESLAGSIFGLHGAWTLGETTRPVADWIARFVIGGFVAAASLGAGLWPEGHARFATNDAGRRRFLLARWLFIMAVLFFCAPAANPWYVTWLLPFLCVMPVRGLLLLTATVPFYYLRFYFEYHEEKLAAAGWTPERAFTWTCWFEYAPVFLLLAAEGWLRRRRLFQQARAVNFAKPQGGQRPCPNDSPESTVG